MTDAPRPNARFAASMLFAACALWGTSFTTVKIAMAGMAEAAGHGPTDTVWVPMIYIGWRFLFASAIWIAVFPRSLRSWSKGCVKDSLVLGGLMSTAMIVQQLGLARTTEGVCAMLTGLTVIFTPLLVWALYRKPPRSRLVPGIALALGGTYLMVLHGEQDMGRFTGNVLSVMCALLFSFHIIALSRRGRNRDAFALTLGQFVVTGVSALVIGVGVGARDGSLSQAVHAAAFTRFDVGWTMAFAVILSTVGAFGLMFRFQPRVHPSLASLIYLAEPVFASLFAWLLVDSTMTWSEIAGACLVLSATAVSFSAAGNADEMN